MIRRQISSANRQGFVKPPPRLTNRQGIVKYLEADLWSWLRDIYDAIFNLTLTGNLKCFTVDNITIPAGEEVAVGNQFALRFPGVIPTGRLIIRQQGNANIIDGDTPWNQTNLFLKNPSGNDAIVNVLFFI